jgi:hypothetical protein
MTATTTTGHVTSTGTRPGSTSRRAVRTTRAACVAAATAANAAFFEVTHAAGTDYLMQNPEGQMVPFHVYEIAFVTAVIGLLGWGTLALFERFTRRPRRNWTVLAAAVLALSFVPVVTVVASTDTKVALAVIHVIVAAGLAPMVRSRRNG